MCISISKLIIWLTGAPTAPHHIFMCLRDIEHEEMLKLLNRDSFSCCMVLIYENVRVFLETTQWSDFFQIAMGTLPETEEIMNGA